MSKPPTDGEKGGEENEEKVEEQLLQQAIPMEVEEQLSNSWVEEFFKQLQRPEQAIAGVEEQQPNSWLEEFFKQQDEDGDPFERCESWEFLNFSSSERDMSEHPRSSHPGSES